MRRAILAFVSLMFYVSIALAWARTHPGPLGVHQPIEALETPDGDDQAEVIVRDVEIVPIDPTKKRISITEYEDRWMVHFKVVKVLKGGMPGSEIRIRVHSPSADLGVTGGVGQRGVLHRYRSDRSESRYEFVPE
jgi:hypothetical protein